MAIDIKIIKAIALYVAKYPSDEVFEHLMDRLPETVRRADLIEARKYMERNSLVNYQNGTCCLGPLGIKISNEINMLEYPSLEFLEDLGKRLEAVVGS